MGLISLGQLISVVNAVRVGSIFWFLAEFALRPMSLRLSSNRGRQKAERMMFSTFDSRDLHWKKENQSPEDDQVVIGAHTNKRRILAV